MALEENPLNRPSREKKSKKKHQQSLKEPVNTAGKNALDK